jgi:hypothetical protein
MCTALTTVTLFGTSLGKVKESSILPRPFHNSSVTSLDLLGNDIKEGQTWWGEALSLSPRLVAWYNKTLIYLKNFVQEPH